ncbi:putative transporter MCH4 [Cyphellophora attinorum]|uniref:Putative transporter MCH4 n=1 Tax=Cyphellophora attinorum TaxID=1664694 RepID=A0A0N0NPL0_9EURO|nr:putative transporter MCH4 [Phialophora attinorum]KPI42669.1 putative transporter MCH4 [Phialophora attinorum]
MALFTDAERSTETLDNSHGVNEKGLETSNEVPKLGAPTLAASPAVPADAEKPPLNPMDPASFPDGGTRAWLTVWGSLAILIASFGWINAIGLFAIRRRWIPALESSCMFAGGLWVGHVYDSYGPRYLLIGGTFLHVFGLMMASISTKYYQLLLSQGLCSAIGASMLFYPALTCTITWFFKKRALAVGIVAAGSGLGGIIFPVMVEKLVPQVGFGWTMRICAFLILALGIFGNLTVTSRIPPMPKKLTVKVLVKPFTEVEFALLGAGAFCMYLGMFQVFTFLVTAGVARGVDRGLALYLVPILNAGSIVGRILPPFVADKVGKVNVFLVSCAATTILILAFWVPVSGTGGIVAFSVLFGFTSGAVVAINPAVVAQISDVRMIGVRTGVMFACVAVAVLIGSPIGGQIVTAGGYRAMQGFSGGMCTLGVAFFAALRWKLGGFGLRSKV